MSRWPRRFARLFVAVGGVMIAAPMSMAVAQTADVESTIGFFEASGQSNGIGLEFGNPNVPPNPVVAGLVPHASSSFSGGPAGRAVSSLAWPGDLAANAGTLAALVGVPLPPEVLANGNYPVKAEASASGGARDEQSLGAMTAIVTDRDAVARTALSDFASPAVVSASRIVTKSRSFEDDGQVGSIAETVLNGVEIGGAVKIDTVHTIAKAVSDGTKATLEQSVTVSGVTVGGQGATIDEKGLHIGSSSNPNPLDGVVAGFNEGFEPAGMEAFVTKPVDFTSEGGAGSVSSGAVVFVYKLGDAGDQVVVTLGGSRALVQATPGSALDLGTDLGSLTGGGGGLDAGSADLGSFNTPVDLGSAGSFGSPSTGATGGGGAGGGGATNIVPADAVLGFENVSSLSDRVPMGWVLIGMLGMIFVGMGLHGVRETALAGSIGTACPLERRAT